ncbi:MAG: S24 family peptidase [Lachnospiraceae bacterium]|nr:S24 family peptidase [Lachnospiraceae bacterium]
MPAFKNVLKILRARENMSQAELAEKLGVAKSTISMYEVGKREPDFVTLEAIADFFNVDMNYLLGKNGSENQRYFSKSTTIYVFDRICADLLPEPAAHMVEHADTEEISRIMASDGEYFGLKISNDSMEPRISEGDIVIARKQEDADDGDLIIAVVNGNDAVCKRLKKYANGIALLSNNPKYEPMYFSRDEVAEIPVSIIGKVKELRARF